MLAPSSLGLEYKDLLCCWSVCVYTGYGSVAASGEAVGSLWLEEECDVPPGSGKLHCRTLEEQERGSREGPCVVAEVEPR